MTHADEVFTPDELLRLAEMPATMPTLMHAIGNGVCAPGEWGRIRLRPIGGIVYRYVSCEHPHEFLDALGLGVIPGNVWLLADDGTRVQLTHVVEVEHVGNDA